MSDTVPSLGELPLCLSLLLYKLPNKVQTFVCWGLCHLFGFKLALYLNLDNKSLPIMLLLPSQFIVFLVSVV